MYAQESSTADYTIRRLLPEDAAGVVACVREVYGDSYIIHTELYHPEEIVRLNETGRLVSVVALDGRGRIVAHYALERQDLRLPAAESGEAMVLAEHRHHHLLEQMRVLLEQEAHRLGLRGIFGRTVTNHVYSQKAVERFGEKPCGVSLGRTPRTFQNMRAPLFQRMSIVFYFKYLQPEQCRPLHLPARHRAMCSSIYQQFGIAAQWQDETATLGPGQHAVDFRPELQRAIIQVHRVGHDTMEAVRSVRRELGGAGRAEVIYLELPLTQPGTPAVCEAAEAERFFFSGIAPLYLTDGDALRLQYLAVELDTSLLQIANPFARELLAYADGERQRVGVEGSL
jgi:hypothetical protein